MIGLPQVPAMHEGQKISGHRLLKKARRLIRAEPAAVGEGGQYGARFRILDLGTQATRRPEMLSKATVNRRAIMTGLGGHSRRWPVLDAG